ncbi:MAG: DUF3179 domain-containing protein [Anaerolineae bacterium]|nr:DUF3179 domain-containing protein [Anaerolineae bacterium]NUQ04980.1 DUF3179 domain-containing protein [Anaerolineae bacterium]
MSETMQSVQQFDVSRAVLQDYGSAFSPARLDVKAVQPLDVALAAGRLAPDAPLLTFEIGGALHTVPMSTVLAYNVMQGALADGQPWMMTFCNACNTGVVFDPRLNGRLLHFQRRGAYDGLMLIFDEETGSYWQHIRGKCLYGPSAGARLPMLAATRMMTAREAAQHREAWLPVHDLSETQRHFAHSMEKMRANPATVEAVIAASIGAEDTRRPRFELGLGVWAESGTLFVPVSTLYAQNNAVVTRFGGRGLVIYVAEDAISPTAVYAETETARWEGDALRLDGGRVIRHDALYESREAAVPRLVERPNQLLVRWFGFSSTFPGCAVLPVQAS